MRPDQLGPWSAQPQKATKPKSKISGRGGTPTSFISEGGALGGAALGATIGSAVPGIGTGIGALVGGVAGAVGGRFAENKVRDDRWGVKDALVEGGWNAIPIGSIAGKGAKGFRAAAKSGKVFKGVADELPRFEINDSKARLIGKAGYQTPLADILDHPELFDNYPHLKDIPVTKVASSTSSFDDGTGQMALGAYDKSPKKALLHEITHAIQKHENFARGGSPTLTDAKDQLDQIESNIVENINGLSHIKDAPTRRRVLAHIDELKQQKEKLVDEPYNEYQRLAGEAEARAVAARADMPESKRDAIPFHDSYDVPLDQLIHKPAGVAGPSMFVRRPDKPTELMATHNLTADNLLHADKLGGIAQPSVGIVDPTKHAIDGFGDITLIGNEKLVDPKIRGNNTFASDVYSPRQPRAAIKSNPATEKALKERFGPELEKYGDGYLASGSAINLPDALAYNPGIMGHFLESKGIKPEVVEPIPPMSTLLRKVKDNNLEDEFSKWLDSREATGETGEKVVVSFLRSKNIEPTFDGLIGSPSMKSENRWNFQKQIRDNKLEDEFKQFTEQAAHEAGAKSMLHGGWTASGKKREIPETLDNALKLMRKEGLRAGEGDFGMGSMRAHITPKLKSVDDIYKNKDKLVSTSDFEKEKNKLTDTYNDLVFNFEQTARREGFDVDGNAAVDGYIRGELSDSLFRHKWGDGLTDSLDVFKNQLKHAPTEYFESVPNRGVNLNEFEKALVPEGTPQTVLDKLKGHGIEHLFYNDSPATKWTADSKGNLIKLANENPNRQEALNKLMAEDNAKRFNPDGTPIVKPAGDIVDGLTPAPKVFRTGPDQYKEGGTENMVARERFNIPALKKISSGGSDRDVYDLGDGHVLKVSKTARGLAQNDAEVDYYAQGEGLIPKTVEAGKNYVVSVKVGKPDANTKKMLLEMGRAADKFGDPYSRKRAIEGVMDKYGYPGSELGNFDYMQRDMMSVRNWGTTADGKPIHLDGGTLNNSILTDERFSPRTEYDYNTHEWKRVKPTNLEDPDFFKVYHQSRAAKKKFGDTDKATMYGLAGALAAGGWAVSTPNDKKKQPSS